MVRWKLIIKVASAGLLPPKSSSSTSSLRWIDHYNILIKFIFCFVGGNLCERSLTDRAAVLLMYIFLLIGMFKGEVRSIFIF